jgi:hypothetical protein
VNGRLWAAHMGRDSCLDPKHRVGEAVSRAMLLRMRRGREGVRMNGVPANKTGMAEGHREFDPGLEEVS